ncbi:hypothetical protein HYX15_03605 [Candidatus Woesearchaeota archaeon]|nr:hypothetical protein [Candidatus Woesearchaeota archaeon]
MLEKLWQNIDNPNEMFFIFKVNEINQAKKFIENAYPQIIKENPKAKLPKMTFLKEK